MSGSGISWAICKPAPRSRQTTTPTPHHSFFTGRMPFLPPNQQRQSTEGTCTCACSLYNNNQTMKYVPEVTKTTLNLDKIRKNKEKEREKTLCLLYKRLERDVYSRKTQANRRTIVHQSCSLREHTMWQSLFFGGGEKNPIISCLL